MLETANYNRQKYPSMSVPKQRLLNIILPYHSRKPLNRVAHVFWLQGKIFFISVQINLQTWGFFVKRTSLCVVWLISTIHVFEDQTFCFLFKNLNALPGNGSTVEL